MPALLTFIRPLLALLVVPFIYYLISEPILDHVLGSAKLSDGLSFFKQLYLLAILTAASAITFKIAVKINDYQSKRALLLVALMIAVKDLSIILMLDNAIFISMVLFYICYFLFKVESGKSQYDTISPPTSQLPSYVGLVYQNSLIRSLWTLSIVGGLGWYLGYIISQCYLSGFLIQSFSLFGNGSSDRQTGSTFFIMLISTTPMILLAKNFKDLISPKHLKIYLVILFPMIFIFGSGTIMLFLTLDMVLLYFVFNFALAAYLYNIYVGINLSKLVHFLRTPIQDVEQAS